MVRENLHLRYCFNSELISFEALEGYIFALFVLLSIILKASNFKKTP